MSAENVELIQHSFDSFNGRDLDAFVGLMDPEVEFTPYERALEGLGIAGTTVFEPGGRSLHRPPRVPG